MCIPVRFRCECTVQAGNTALPSALKSKNYDHGVKGRADSRELSQFFRFFLQCFTMALILTSIVVAPVQSQEKKESKEVQDPEEVVRIKSNLVNIDVMVKDKSGKYVADLTADDFQIFENGMRQRIEFFDSPLMGRKGPPSATAQVEVTSNAQVTNYVSLVLDTQTTDVTNLKQVREGIARYAREQIAETDAVALFSVTSSLQLVQTFTQDKEAVIKAIENLGSTASSRNSEQRDFAAGISALRDQLASAPSTPAAEIDSPAAGAEAARAMIAARMLQQFVRLRTALSLQQSRPILAALASICEGLRAIPGKKTLVLFSQGFVTPAVLDWQVQSTVDIANRANVAIYIIDAAGLRVGAPRSGALVPGSPLAGVSAITNQEQRIRGVGGETVFDNTRQEGANREYDILYRLSGDTGGKFFKGNNDIGKGLERINEEIHSRYTLAYRSTNQNFDGTFRKIKIEISRPQVQVVSRSGYYAIPPGEIVLFSPEDKKLLNSFDAAAASPEMPIFVELSPFRSRDGLYTVPMSIELPPAAVKFDRRDGKHLTQLEVLGVLKTTSETVLSRLGGKFEVSLTAEQYQSILSNNIFYRQDLLLAPGDYTIDLVVKDRLSGKTSAVRQSLALPEPDSEFAVTPVVLSRYVERAELPRLNSAEPPDVFIHGNAQIRPSPGRTFQAADNLIMLLAVYNAAMSPDTGQPLVRVTVRLIKDGQPVTKPFDYVLTELKSEPVSHLTFAEYLRLSALPAGKYIASIEAKDMVTRKLVKQEAPFVITQ